MPFEVIDTLDPLTALVDFRTSAVYEMVISIRTWLKPARRQEAWVRRATASLPSDLLKELKYLYEEFSDGGLYFELPVDYQDHADVPGFLDYVRGLSDAEFCFYLLGRTIPLDELAELLPDGDAVRSTLATKSDHYEWYGRYIDPILEDISAFRKRLVNAWEAYWKVFFRQEIAPLESMWMAGLQEKRAILEREGGRALLEKVTGRSQLPPELPPGMPISSITFMPVCLLPARVYRFHGYGNVTVLFDPQFTEATRIALEQAKDEAMATLKALNDEKRLEILRLIVQHHHGQPHGKSIAEKTDISASAVSRHLALLKEGNLIAEEPHKNLITYRFQRETLTSLVDKLLDYLYSEA